VSDDYFQQAEDEKETSQWEADKHATDQSDEDKRETREWEQDKG
jgi:hypothetical protein